VFVAIAIRLHEGGAKGRQDLGSPERQSARAGQKAGAISIRGLRIAETEGNREQASINK